MKMSLLELGKVIFVSLFAREICDVRSTMF